MLYDFEERRDRPMSEKVTDLQEGGRLKHAIFSRQFDRDLLERLCEQAMMIRGLSQTAAGRAFLASTLAHRRAMLYFTQPSTRTFLSFMAACQIMGLSCNEIRDPTLSSEFKGESVVDSVRMFSSYFDLIIMRSKLPGLAEECAYLMNDLSDYHQRNIPIINGGAGTDEHPTQALLDMFTVRRTFEQLPADQRSISGKTYAFCGDVGRSRTVRSLVYLLALYENVRMVFVAPNYKPLALSSEMRTTLEGLGIDVQEVDGLEPVIEDIDVLYMTRIQHEHNSGEDKRFFAEADLSRFKLTPQLLGRMKATAAILHPFPRNDEIPVAIDSDPRAKYFRQARNGMWIRAALIGHVFGLEDAIRDHYQA